jgi:membrane protein involved in D-alanine export
VIQLNTLLFWIVCAAGVLVVAPVRSFRLRQALLAALNVTFLIMLLRRPAFGLLAAIVVVYGLLRLVDGRLSRTAAASTLAVGVAALFLVHKLPLVAAGTGADSVARILGLIGYSYVALRMVELLRAVFERRHPAPDLVSTVNYLLPFHMLAAGPIQAYDDFVEHASDNFEPTARATLVAFERIASGVFKKFVIAYFLQTVFLTNFEATGAYRLLELQIFFVWLFLDFSAYSDIAVGVGMLLGVTTPENFNRPLLARNVIEFWERWHISLSLFIRRNIFIPVQMFLMRQNGARTPLVSAAAATTVSFVLCGLWHGLTLGFLIWGMAQALGLIVVRLYADALRVRLGKAGVAHYLANSWFRAAAVVLTFEFQAAVLLTMFKV